MVNNLPQVLIVTPTVGRDCLFKAVQSVVSQTYSNIIHLIVIDGEEYSERVKRLVGSDSDKRKTISLPFNTGQQGFYGHRIYAAVSYLVNADYVCYLDEDNWYDSNHVMSLVTLLQQNDLDWAYSLRKIFSFDGNFIANDNCESLGPWPAYSGMPDLVDTSCYAIKTSVLTRIGHHWFNKFAADRIFFKELSNYSQNYATTSLYTLNYTLHEAGMPNKEFILRGNSAMLEKYQDCLPWLEFRKVKRG